jgi:hypothetical protein
MKYLVLTLVLLTTTNCAALGLDVSTLDKAAVDQNMANVAQLVGENTVYVEADTTKTDALKQASRDRNQAALELARKMQESAR